MVMLKQKALKTADLANDFYKDCKKRGLAASTIATTEKHLRHFVSDNLALPTEAPAIESWLLLRKESFDKRGDTFRRVQMFYKYLDNAGILSPSPIPPGIVGRPSKPPKPKRPTGRPRKIKSPEISVGGVQLSQSPSQAPSLSPSPPSSSPAHLDTAALVDEFLTSCESRGLSDGTVRNRRFFLEHFAARYPELPFNLKAIEDFLAATPKVQDSYRTLQFQTLRTFYYWIEERNNLSQAHLKFHLAKPKLSHKVKDSLSGEQVLKLLSLEMPPSHRALIELLIEAGPRKGEIRSITAENVGENRITVNGKTGQHIIGISPDLACEIKALKPSGIIWDLSACHIYRIIRGYLEQIGIHSGKRGTHMLRHTMGRLYLENGGDLESLRQQLGHTKITTTALYAELATDQVHKQAMAASPLQAAKRQMSGQYIQQYGDPNETAAKKHERESAKPLPGQIHMDQYLKGEEDDGSEV